MIDNTSHTTKWLHLHCRDCVNLQKQFPKLKHCFDSYLGRVVYDSLEQAVNFQDSLTICPFHNKVQINVQTVDVTWIPYKLTLLERAKTEKKEVLDGKTNLDKHNQRHFKKYISYITFTPPKNRSSIPESQSLIDNFMHKTEV